MKRLLILAVLAVGCDDSIPSSTTGKATNCTTINTPIGCPTVYRITDPDTGAVLYVATGPAALTLLPKSEVSAEKPPAK